MLTKGARAFLCLKAVFKYEEHKAIILRALEYLLLFVESDPFDFDEISSQSFNKWDYYRDKSRYLYVLRKRYIQ
tara:strand:+ start:1279 stop:1500 length:222 start_codon:yes stop_codon:yes gene_type:complete